jgi:hypothetical protein
MSGKDAITSFLVCFNSPDEGHGSTVQVCLGLTPRSGQGLGTQEGPYFIRVQLSNVHVTLPPPLPGTQPVQGHVTITQVLPLSATDVVNLDTWLHEYAPKKPKE